MKRIIYYAAMFGGENRSLKSRLGKIAGVMSMKNEAGEEITSIMVFPFCYQVCDAFVGSSRKPIPFCCWAFWETWRYRPPVHTGR